MNITETLYRLIVLFLLVCSISFTTSSCAGKNPATTREEPKSSESVPSEDKALSDSDSGKALGLKTINFSYGSANLTSTSKRTLKENAKILKANPKVKIQVEGHTDERGASDYNKKLGERRARSVKTYLHTLVIAGKRIDLISYGEERPLDSAGTEEAYDTNRRVNFVITSK